MEYSSFTFPIVPVLSHVIFSLEPTTHASPPFGAVSVMEPFTSKFAADTALTSLSVTSETRTFSVVPIASATDQE